MKDDEYYKGMNKESVKEIFYEFLVSKGMDKIRAAKVIEDCPELVDIFVEKVIDECGLVYII
jgi:hypothetical protein